MTLATREVEQATTHVIPNGPFARLGRWSGRHRRWVIAVWIVVFVVLGPLALRLSGRLSQGGFEIGGLDVAECQQRRFAEVRKPVPGDHDPGADQPDAESQRPGVPGGARQERCGRQDGRRTGHRPGGHPGREPAAGVSGRAHRADPDRPDRGYRPGARAHEAHHRCRRGPVDGRRARRGDRRPGDLHGLQLGQYARPAAVGDAPGPADRARARAVFRVAVGGRDPGDRHRRRPGEHPGRVVVHRRGDKPVDLRPERRPAHRHRRRRGLFAVHRQPLSG